MKVIDFHVHIGLKEHWKEWVRTYQQATGSEYYDRYDELTDPDKFALYLKRAGIEKAVILPEISPITTGVVSNEYVLEFCQGNETFIPFCTVNPSLVGNPGNEFKRYIGPGDREGQHSIRVNDQFRICFIWRDGDAFEVEIADYH